MITSKNLTLEQKTAIAQHYLSKSDAGYPFDDWHESVYEKWIAYLEEQGFKNPQISYSGFWSQGDGASFTFDSCTPNCIKKIADNLWLVNGFVPKTPDFITRSGAMIPTKQRLIDWLMEDDDSVFDATAYRSGNYVHEKSITVSVDTSWTQFERDLDDEFESFVNSQKLVIPANDDMSALERFRHYGFGIMEEQPNQFDVIFGNRNGTFRIASIHKAAFEEVQTDILLKREAEFLHFVNQTYGIKSIKSPIDFVTNLEMVQRFLCITFFAGIDNMLPFYGKDLNPQNHEMSVEDVLNFYGGPDAERNYIFKLDEELVELGVSIEENLQKWCENKNSEIYKDLESDYQAITTEDAVIEYLEANDMLEEIYDEVYGDQFVDNGDGESFDDDDFEEDEYTFDQLSVEGRAAAMKHWLGANHEKLANFVKYDLLSEPLKKIGLTKFEVTCEFVDDENVEESGFEFDFDMKGWTMTGLVEVMLAGATNSQMKTQMYAFAAGKDCELKNIYESNYALFISGIGAKISEKLLEAKNSRKLESFIQQDLGENVLFNSRGDVARLV